MRACVGDSFFAMTDSHIAGLAGEHFVAYRVAMLGFIPALVRQTVRGVDLLVSNPETGKSVAVQIKSAASAVHERRGASESQAFHLRFPLGQRAIAGTADNTVFCFVDLRRKAGAELADVYVIPAAVLKKEYAGLVVRKYRYTQHHRPVDAMEPFRNNWSPLIAALVSDEKSPTEIEKADVAG
jgi:hypothetical protein